MPTTHDTSATQEKGSHGHSVSLPLAFAAIAIALIVAAYALRPPRTADPLDLTDHEVAVTDTNLNEVLAENRVALLDFSASWCGPCRMLAPTVQAIAEDYDDVTVGIVNADDPAAAGAIRAYNVLGLPHLVITLDGETRDTITGYVSAKELRSRIDVVLGER